MRTCLQCRKALPEGSSSQRLYCSGRCRSRAWRGHAKRCTACHRLKARSAFGRSAAKADGLEPRCRACRSAQGKASYIPRPRKPRKPKHDGGARFGSLVIVERLGEHKKSQRVRCRCDCGSVREYSLQNLVSGLTGVCADRSAHPDPRSAGDEVGYSGAHRRVRNLKGSASEHKCCRCERQAEHWAYSNGDIDQVIETSGRETGKAYSVNPDHYLPMCRADHTRFDNAHRRIAHGGLSLAHVALWLATN